MTMCSMLLGGSTIAPPAQSPPIADPVVLTVAPGESVLIPFSGSDPDGDLFGFFPTAGLSNPSAGALLVSCVCRGTYAGVICNCTTFFTAAPDFAGSVTFTYRAVDTEGNESADATVTINSTSAARTPEQILAEIVFIIKRGIQPGGDIDPGLEEPLLGGVDQTAHSLFRGRLIAAGNTMRSLRAKVLAAERAGRMTMTATIELLGLMDAFLASGFFVCVNIHDHNRTLLIVTPRFADPPWEPDFDNPHESVGFWEVFSYSADHGARGLDGIVTAAIEAAGFKGTLVVRMEKDPDMGPATDLREDENHNAVTVELGPVTVFRESHQHFPGTWEHDDASIERTKLDAEDMVRSINTYVKRNVPLEEGEHSIRNIRPLGEPEEFRPFGPFVTVRLKGTAWNTAECGETAMDDLSLEKAWGDFDGFGVDIESDPEVDPVAADDDEPCVFCPPF